MKSIDKAIKLMCDKEYNSYRDMEEVFRQGSTVILTNGGRRYFVRELGKDPYIFSFDTLEEAKHFLKKKSSKDAKARIKNVNSFAYKGYYIIDIGSAWIVKDGDLVVARVPTEKEAREWVDDN